MFWDFNETYALVAKIQNFSFIFSLSVINCDMKSSFSSSVKFSVFRNGNLGMIAKEYGYVK